MLGALKIVLRRQHEQRWVAWCYLSIVAIVAVPNLAPAADLMGVACERPAPLHCPNYDCLDNRVAAPGNAIEPKSGRRFFLDYPCNMKPREKVIFVLDLHGGGLTANWQRHYFPIIDFADKYRLVIVTPNGTGNSWIPAVDDTYLHNIVEEVEAAIGKNNIKAFWLVGHSLGGQTANRLINDDPFFRERLTGWVSLSGGRLGNTREEVRAPIPAGSGGLARTPVPGTPPGAPLALTADASVLPPTPFSFIYETGEHELTSAGLPRYSRWAEQLKCGSQTRAPDIVDTKAGYVDDIRPLAIPSPIWGLRARPGTARLYLYPNCAAGRFVADIVRIDKGHTEGLEPHITEEIVKLMVGATSRRPSGGR
jgi:pimeloyl-ACP methyl ester carboxylesterase